MNSTKNNLKKNGALSTGTFSGLKHSSGQYAKAASPSGPFEVPTYPNLKLSTLKNSEMTYLIYIGHTHHPHSTSLEEATLTHVLMLSKRWKFSWSSYSRSHTWAVKNIHITKPRSSHSSHPFLDKCGDCDLSRSLDMVCGGCHTGKTTSERRHKPERDSAGKSKTSTEGQRPPRQCPGNSPQVTVPYQRLKLWTSIKNCSFLGDNLPCFLEIMFKVKSLMILEYIIYSDLESFEDNFLIINAHSQNTRNNDTNNDKNSRGDSK